LLRSSLPPLAEENHVCPTCEIAYASTSIEQATAALAIQPAAVRSAVLAIPEASLRRRPDPVTWSVLEYVCHLRDVNVTFTIRLYRTRAEDHPLLEPMFNDLRAVRFSYNTRDLPAVLDELADANMGLRQEVARVPDDGWDREASRLPGEARTARWLVRQAMHEGVHHLRDIEEVAGKVSGQP
jgi:hypothetical protein